jgi:hypothetical protein
MGRKSKSSRSALDFSSRRFGMTKNKNLRNKTNFFFDSFLRSPAMSCVLLLFMFNIARKIDEKFNPVIIIVISIISRRVGNIRERRQKKLAPPREVMAKSMLSRAGLSTFFSGLKMSLFYILSSSSSTAVMRVTTENFPDTPLIASDDDVQTYDTRSERLTK